MSLPTWFKPSCTEEDRQQTRGELKRSVPQPANICSAPLCLLPSHGSAGSTSSTGKKALTGLCELAKLTLPEALPNFTATVLPLLEGFQSLSLKFFAFQFLLNVIKLCLQMIICLESLLQAHSQFPVVFSSYI